MTGLTPAFIEEMELKLEFVKRVASLGVWLPQPTIYDWTIEFAFARHQLPADLRISLSEEEQNNAVIERFKTAARAIGGRWQKNDPKASTYDDTWYTFTNEQKIGDATLVLRMERDTVCERVVVGKKTVVKPAVPAQPEQIVEEVEYERECKPLFKHAEAELDAAMKSLEASDEVIEGELEDA